MTGYSREISNTADVLALIGAGVPAAAVSAALRLGLFWHLAERPKSSVEVSRELGIPHGRCLRWLELLGGLGLVESGDDGWRPSSAARAAILDVYSAESWAMLAQEALEGLAGVVDLPARLRDGVPEAEGRSYTERMAADPERARRFSRMLLELHRPLAARVAAELDLAGVRRLLDLGGGSAVVSMALTKRWPDLSVTLLDIGPVCAAATEIVAEAGLAGRISTWPADFAHDALPGGFDVVLECDVGVYDESLFRRIGDALEPAGRLVIVDEFVGEAGKADPTRLAWALARSLRDPEAVPATVSGTVAMLEGAGFELLSVHPLPPLPNVGGRLTDLLLIEAGRA